MTDETPKHAEARPAWLTPRKRAYLYAVAIAAGAIATGYGLLTIEEAGLWLALLGTVLGVTGGVAVKNLEQ